MNIQSDFIELILAILKKEIYKGSHYGVNTSDIEVYKKHFIFNNYTFFYCNKYKDYEKINPVIGRPSEKAIKDFKIFIDKEFLKFFKKLKIDSYFNIESSTIKLKCGQHQYYSYRVEFNTIPEEKINHTLSLLNLNDVKIPCFLKFWERGAVLFDGKYLIQIFRNDNSDKMTISNMEVDVKESSFVNFIFNYGLSSNNVESDINRFRVSKKIFLRYVFNTIFNS